MNSKPSRNSSLIVCCLFIGSGLLVMLGTIIAAFLLKDGIVGRIGKPKGFESLTEGFRIHSLDRQIESTERDIDQTKRISEPKPNDQAIEGINKLSNKNIESNSFSILGDKSERLKKLEAERKVLIEKREALQEQSQARANRSRSFNELWEDYGGRVLFFAVLPLGFFSLGLARFVFGGKLPARNPLSLTDFERRSILFFAFSIVFSAFGFFSFIWILILID